MKNTKKNTFIILISLIKGTSNQIAYAIGFI